MLCRRISDRKPSTGGTRGRRWWRAARIRLLWQRWRWGERPTRIIDESRLHLFLEQRPCLETKHHNTKARETWNLCGRERKTNVDKTNQNWKQQTSSPIEYRKLRLKIVLLYGTWSTTVRLYPMISPKMLCSSRIVMETSFWLRTITLSIVDKPVDWKVIISK